MIRGAVGGAALAFALATLLAWRVHAAAVRGVRRLLPRLLDVPPRQAYAPATGDLVLLQYASAGLAGHPVFRAVPTHCGIVWVRPSDALAFVIEATRFQRPALPPLWPLPRADGGVRVVRFADLHASADALFAVRPLIHGRIDDAALEALVRGLSARMRFEPRVSNNMGPLELIALGFAPLAPQLARRCGMWAGLAAKPRDSVFCSELVSRLLQQLGHVDASFNEHWLVAPSALTSGVGVLDELSRRSARPLSWGVEKHV
jgi:hypothetical protein